MRKKKPPEKECGPQSKWEPLKPYLGALVCRAKHLHIFPEELLRDAGFQVNEHNIRQIEITFAELAADRGLKLSVVE